MDSTHWYLEVVFKHYGGWPDHHTLNGCKIITSAGTFYFKDWIHVTNDSILVLTQDSLKNLLKINRSGDHLTIKDSAGNWLDELYFGNVAGSKISFPRLGQSIVNYAYECFSGGPDTEYHKVKDNHPTIGFNAFKPYNLKGVTTSGTFAGIVYDNMHSPVPGIHLGHMYYNVPCGSSAACGNFFCSVLTDSAGTFNIPERSGRYLVQIFFKTSNVLADSVINIEPDSINYYEFTIDTLLTGINPVSAKKEIALSCFPNPSTGETMISFEIPAGRHYSQALIKIYNSIGEIVRILPVTLGRSSVKWNGLTADNSSANGIYSCTLELDGQKTASSKIIIAK